MSSSIPRPHSASQSDDEQDDSVASIASGSLPERIVEEIPDGGIRAWLVVAGAFFVWFNSWGAINAFGSFQTFYQLGLLQSYSPSDIAWIGSVQNFLVLFVGFLSGPLYDAGYGNYLLGVGGLLNVFGMGMLSLSKEYYQVFLSQGICVGLGWGLSFTPAASLPSRFFRNKLALATGLASAGTGIGGKWLRPNFCQALTGLGNRDRILRCFHTPSGAPQYRLPLGCQNPGLHRSHDIVVRVCCHERGNATASSSPSIR